MVTSSRDVCNKRWRSGQLFLTASLRPSCFFCVPVSSLPSQPLFSLQLSSHLDWCWSPIVIVIPSQITARFSMDVVAPANVPQISISPPPPEEPLPEPYSPFARTFTFADDDDAFRPQHLTPPPTHTRFAKQLSPLRPSEATVTGQGLERERFETLLQASKERNLLVGGKKTLDLRKEIALKAHKNKQGMCRLKGSLVLVACVDCDI